jgi:ribosome-associated heat shock protein Hsp15
MTTSVEPQLQEAVRIDRWLCAARLYQSRSLAQAACTGGHVKHNGVSVRASHLVRVGDRIECVAPSGRRDVQVTALADKRQPPQRARELYEDHSPPPPPRDERVQIRPRGAGRPTKAERRSLERLRGEF